MKRWTKTDDDFLRNNYLKYNHKEMAKILDRSENSINFRCWSNGFIRGKLNTNRKFFINDKYFNVWSHDMAYILGYITADGYLYKDKTLKFDCSFNDIELLEFIKKQISPNSKIKVYYRKNKNKIGFSKYCCLSIHSTILVTSLIKFGLCQNKSGKEVLPNIPPDYVWDYFRGYFDGDGCIHTSIRNSYRRQDFIIVCKSDKFLISLNNMINNICNIYYPKKAIPRLATSKKKTILYIFDNMYKMGFFLKRKYNIFKEIKNG